MSLSPQKLFKLAKYADLKTHQITRPVLETIGDILGFTVPDGDVTDRVITLLSENNVDAVADLLGRPDLVEKLARFMVTAESPDEELEACEVCGEYYKPTPVCPHCGHQRKELT